MIQDLGAFDYVIVGAGTAGCLLANRLSADPANRVALLEAGGRDNYHWIHIPVGYLYLMGNPRTDWGYKTAPTPGLNGRELNYPRGRVLGGCSSINGMIYMRGQARDYDLSGVRCRQHRLGLGRRAAVLQAHIEDQWAIEPDSRPRTDLHTRAAANGGSSRRACGGIFSTLFAEAAARGRHSEKQTTSTAGNNEGCELLSRQPANSGVRWNTAKAFLQARALKPCRP